MLNDLQIALLVYIIINLMCTLYTIDKFTDWLVDKEFGKKHDYSISIVDIILIPSYCAVIIFFYFGKLVTTPIFKSKG